MRLRATKYSSMSDTVTVIVGHHLGRAEAVHRLKEGLARTNGHLGALIAIEQETWQVDTLRFRMRTLGQTAAASIEVLARCGSKCRCLGSWRRQRNGFFRYCVRKRRCSWRKNKARAEIRYGSLSISA